MLVGGLYLVAINTVGASRVTQGAFADRERGTLLGEALLTEVLALPFEDPAGTLGALGRESGEAAGARGAFDDVDDLLGYAEALPVDRAGVAIAGAGRFRRGVAVAYVDPAKPDLPVATQTALKRVAVTVTVDGRMVAEVVGLSSAVWPTAPEREEPTH